jgi:hypothetical protein
MTLSSATSTRIGQPAALPANAEFISAIRLPGRAGPASATCCFLDQAVASVFNSWDWRAGLDRQASRLAPSVCLTASQHPTEVSITSTVSRMAGSDLIALASVIPSMPGI